MEVAGASSDTREERRSPLPAITLYGLVLAAVAAVLYFAFLRGTAPLSEPHLRVVGDRGSAG